MVEIYSNPVASDIASPGTLEEGATAIQRDATSFKQHRRTFMVIAYCLLQVARTITLIIYIGRAVKCCLDSKTVTFLCENDAFVAHDYEVEVVWLILSLVNIVICLKMLIAWHGMPDLKILTGISVRRSGMWTLVFLVLTSIISFVILTNKNDISARNIVLVSLFECQIIFITMAVVILNGTIVSMYTRKNNYKTDALFLIKMTHVLLFSEFFVLFIIGTLQLGFEVNGLENSPSRVFQKVFTVLRQFSEVFFYHKISSFLWVKLFLDEKDILNDIPLKHHHKNIKYVNV